MVHFPFPTYCSLLVLACPRDLVMTSECAAGLISKISWQVLPQMSRKSDARIFVYLINCAGGNRQNDD